MKEFYNKVVEEASSWVGATEIAGNMGFNDELLETLMRQVNWDLGQAWCALFAKLCWLRPTYQGKSKYFNKMYDLFSAGAVATYNNFKKDEGGLFRVDNVPVRGSVMIMQKYNNGNPHWSGHAGIVEEVLSNEVNTIEGNTNASGGREGVQVARKTRALNFEGDNGLVLKGFIKIN